MTTDVARRELQAEVSRLGGERLVVSTNVPLRRDGNPYSDIREPSDVGVAVYFVRKGRRLVFCCDAWNTVSSNLWAVVKTIDALRGVER